MNLSNRLPEGDKRPATEAWELLRRPDGSFNAENFKNFDVSQYGRMGRKFQLKSNPGRDFPDPFDLNNLICIPPNFVQNFLERLEESARKNPDKLIMAIIGTGGTIAMSEEDGALKAKLSPMQILQEAGSRVQNQFAAEGLEYIQLDSSQLERQHVGDLVIMTSYIMKHASTELRDRLVFVITHGTDTLAESEAAYNDSMGPFKRRPVGFVAAQKTTADDYSDVGINFANTAYTLKRLHMQQKYPSFFYMGASQGGAYSGLLSTKASDVSVDAFKSEYGPKAMDASNFGLQGTNLDFHDAFFAQTNRPISHNFRPLIQDEEHSVFAVDSVPFRNKQIVERSIDANRELITAVMLSSYGAYTSNDILRNKIIRKCKELGLPLIGTNPIPLAMDTHKYEPAIALREHAIMAESRPYATEQKATLAHLIKPNDGQYLRDAIENNDWAGEQPPAHIWTLANGTRKSVKYSMGPPAEIFDRVGNGEDVPMYDPNDPATHLVQPVQEKIVVVTDKRKPRKKKRGR